MTNLLIAFIFGLIFLFGFVWEFDKIKRDRRNIIITTLLAKAKKDGEDRFIPVGDDGENLDLQKENREEESDIGDDDAILGL